MSQQSSKHVTPHFVRTINVLIDTDGKNQVNNVDNHDTLTSKYRKKSILTTVIDGSRISL